MKIYKYIPIIGLCLSIFSGCTQQKQYFTFHSEASILKPSLGAGVVIEQLKEAGVRVKPLLVESGALTGVEIGRKEHAVTGAGLTAAVLDTGIRASHGDFKGRVVFKRNFTSENSDDAEDRAGHGTHVAGVIAARGALHVGFAPDARVVALKVLNDAGVGEWKWTADALEWVIDNGGKFDISVVSMSLGGGHFSKVQCSELERDMQRICAAIKKLKLINVPVIVSSGNSYYEYQNGGMGFPAIVPESVSVGCVYDMKLGQQTYRAGAVAYRTQPDQITPFSERLQPSQPGIAYTTILAPGAIMTSTGIGSDSGSSSMSGTSQSAPVVAGCVLLAQELFRRKHGVLPSVDLLVKAMRDSGKVVDDIETVDDNVANSGGNFPRIDAARFLNQIATSSP